MNSTNSMNCFGRGTRLTHHIRTRSSLRSHQSRVASPESSSFIPHPSSLSSRCSLRLCGRMFRALRVLRGELIQHSVRETQAFSSRPFATAHSRR